MLYFIFILIFIDCLLLTAVVLVQESKGGGLASGFSSANQVMGVKKTADFLERATWTLAIVLMGLCLAAAAIQGPAGGNVIGIDEGDSGVIEQIENDPTQLPQAPQVPQSIQQQPAPNQSGEQPAEEK